jgi:hypothetical protein
MFDDAGLSIRGCGDGKRGVDIEMLRKGMEKVERETGNVDRPVSISCDFDMIESPLSNILIKWFDAQSGLFHKCNLCVLSLCFVKSEVMISQTPLLEELSRGRITSICIDCLPR